MCQRGRVGHGADHQAGVAALGNDRDASLDADLDHRCHLCRVAGPHHRERAAGLGLFTAGGTGLAPFLAMLEVLQASGTQQPVHLIYGVPTDAALVEGDQLHAFAKTIPGFTFATVVADAASDHPRKGYVTHHLPDAALHGGDVDIYLCGPPPMVDAVRAFLDTRGVSPANFHFEKFSPSEAGK